MIDSSNRKLIIAIDGPAGVGKSTIASRLARRLGYANLESGAMYRALALKAIEWDISFDDEPALIKLAHSSRIQLQPTSTGTRVLLDERDVTQQGIARPAGCARGQARLLAYFGEDALVHRGAARPGAAQMRLVVRAGPVLGARRALRAGDAPGLANGQGRGVR